MSLLFNRKLNNYAERKQNLIASYTSLREPLKDLDDEDGNLENTFDILLEWDQLVYQYNAYKSCLDLSKTAISPDGQAMMKNAEALVNSIERKLPIPYLIAEVQSLAIIRRELHENAKEAGKIYMQHETSLASQPSSKRSLETKDYSPAVSSVPVTKRPKFKQEDLVTVTPVSSNADILRRYPKLTNWRDHTWSKEHVKCIFLGHALKNTYYDRIDSIRKLLQDRVNVFVSKQLVSYLLLHYGLRSASISEVDTKRLKKAFDEAYVLNEEAIQARKYEGVRSHIKESIDYLISKSDAQYGAKFRQFFVTIYGRCMEPESNYKEFEHPKFTADELSIDIDQIELQSNPQKLSTETLQSRKGRETLIYRDEDDVDDGDEDDDDEDDDKDDEVEEDEDDEIEDVEDDDDDDDEDEYEAIEEEYVEDEMEENDDAEESDVVVQGTLPELTESPKIILKEKADITTIHRMLTPDAELRNRTGETVDIQDITLTQAKSSSSTSMKTVQPTGSIEPLKSKSSETSESHSNKTAVNNTNKAPNQKHAVPKEVSSPKESRPSTGSETPKHNSVSEHSSPKATKPISDNTTLASNEVNSPNAAMNPDEMINRDLKLIYTKNKELPGLLFKIQKYVEAKYGRTLLLSQLNERLLNMGFEVNSAAVLKKKSPYQRTNLPSQSENSQTTVREPLETTVRRNLTILSKGPESNVANITSSYKEPVSGSLNNSTSISEPTRSGIILSTTTARPSTGSSVSTVASVQEQQSLKNPTVLPKKMVNVSSQSPDTTTLAQEISNTVQQQAKLDSSMALPKTPAKKVPDQNMRSAISSNNPSSFTETGSRHLPFEVSAAVANLGPGSSTINDSEKNSAIAKSNENLVTTENVSPGKSMLLQPSVASAFNSPRANTVKIPSEPYAKNSVTNLPAGPLGEKLNSKPVTSAVLSKVSSPAVPRSMASSAPPAIVWTDDLYKTVKRAADRIPIDTPNRVSLIANLIKQTTGKIIPEEDIALKIEEMEDSDESEDDETQYQDKIRQVLGEIIRNICYSMPSDDHYRRKFETLNPSPIWSFEFNKILTSTVEYLASFSNGASDALKNVGRQHLISICLYRLSNEGCDKSMNPDTVMRRLIYMRDHDIFSPEAYDLITIFLAG